MMAEKMFETVTARLPDDLYAKLQAHGEKLDRKLGWIARQAIIEYLERHADPGLTVRGEPSEVDR